MKPSLKTRQFRRIWLTLLILCQVLSLSCAPLSDHVTLTFELAKPENLSNFMETLLTWTYEQDLTAPIGSNKFDCVFVNVMAADIGTSWATYGAAVTASGSTCGYYGVASGMVKVADGGKATLTVAKGVSRYIEVIGVTLKSGTSTCPAIVTDAVIRNTTLYPGMYELGRKKKNATVSATIEIENNYDGAVAKDFRCFLGLNT